MTSYHAALYKYFFFLFLIFQVTATQWKPVKVLGLLQCHGTKTDIFSFQKYHTSCAKHN